jgi:hypothetical protein
MPSSVACTAFVNAARHWRFRMIAPVGVMLEKHPFVTA